MDLKDNDRKRHPSLLPLILFFGFLKAVIHLSTNTNYGFHRDEFLYLDLGKHLGWGFMEVPPGIALVASMADLLGADLFWVRVLPTLAGTCIVLLIGWMVKELGGGKWALIFACSAFILAPAFLRTNLLFQPVSFNQLFWFLSAIILIRLTKKGEPKYWYWFGAVAGIGFLFKYSIVFYLLALVIALLFTRHRKWFTSRHPYLGAILALLIAAPNLLWQYQHAFPVLHHMEELQSTQLVNVDMVAFFLEQLLMLSAASIVCIWGLISLLTNRQVRDDRFLAFAFIICLALIALLKGKPYYTLGAYPILLVFGGLAMERQIRRMVLRPVVLGIMILITLPILPFALPVLKMGSMLSYCKFMNEEIHLSSPMRWEDGKIYPLPQDYADMNGWKEIAEDVSTLYHSLPEEEKQNCMIYGGSYGHAGSINYYRKEYNLPEAHSFNSSYVIWAPDSLHFESQIYIDDQKINRSSYFHQFELIDSIDDPYARDPGYIYYRTEPKIDLDSAWMALARQIKSEFNF